MSSSNSLNSSIFIWILAYHIQINLMLKRLLLGPTHKHIAYINRNENLMRQMPDNDTDLFFVASMILALGNEILHFVLMPKLNVWY